MTECVEECLTGLRISYVIDQVFGSEFSKEPEVEHESLQGSVIGPVLSSA